MKRTGPTSPTTQKLIQDIKKLYVKEKAPFWKMMIKHLEKPTRMRASVNLGKLMKYSGKEILVVPGKVLSMGDAEKTLKVAALSYSDGAKKKLEDAKAEFITLEDLIAKNPKAKGVKLIL